jgi:hypothetical protein
MQRHEVAVHGEAQRHIHRGVKKIHGRRNRKHVTDEQHQRNVESVLKPQQPVIGEVAHVDFGTKLLHIGVLFAHQPAHVGEEEAALRVVWIGIGVAVLVVNAVVADPLDDRILHGDGVEEEQNELHFSVGLVGAMTPQPMGTGRYAKRSEPAVDVVWVWV